MSGRVWKVKPLLTLNYFWGAWFFLDVSRFGNWVVVIYHKPVNVWFIAFRIKYAFFELEEDKNKKYFIFGNSMVNVSPLTSESHSDSLMQPQVFSCQWRILHSRIKVGFMFECCSGFLCKEAGQKVRLERAFLTSGMKPVWWRQQKYISYLGPQGTVRVCSFSLWFPNPFSKDMFPFDTFSSFLWH